MKDTLLALLIIFAAIVLSVLFYPVQNIKYAKMESGQKPSPKQKPTDGDIKHMDSAQSLKLLESTEQLTQHQLAILVHNFKATDQKQSSEINDTKKACEKTLELVEKERNDRIAAENKTNKKTIEAETKETAIFWIALLGLFAILSLKLFRTKTTKYKKSSVDLIITVAEATIAVLILCTNKVL